MKKILLFHYFGGAGGKFIANCLGFSKKVAFANYKTALDVIQNNNIKLLEQCLLQTIPKKSQSRRWHELEQGCHLLFGQQIQNVRQGQFSNVMLNDLDALGDVWLPLISHDIENFNHYQNFFLCDKVFSVLVNGDTEFIDLAIRKKWPKEHHCIDLHAYEKFNKDAATVKFDFVISNWNPCIRQNYQHIIDLSKQLGCEFDLRLAENYIEKYIDFHV